MIQTTGEKTAKIILNAKRAALVAELGARPFSSLTPQEKDRILEYLWEKDKTFSDKIV